MDNGKERCLARRIGIEYGGGRGLRRKLEYIGEGCTRDKYREEGMLDNGEARCMARRSGIEQGAGRRVCRELE